MSERSPGTPIAKGELRFGSLVDFKGNTSLYVSLPCSLHVADAFFRSAWRHWGCVTSKIISNMKVQFEDPADLDGFEDLNDDDQERIRKAYEDGHVADEDVPESARKPEADVDDDDEEDDEKPKKKAAAKGKKAADDQPGKFKLEYASSGRAKCKGKCVNWLLRTRLRTCYWAGGCDETIAKDYFRLGHEVDFRGNKSL
jgi:hypothetical protein